MSVQSEYISESLSTHKMKDINGNHSCIKLLPIVTHVLATTILTTINQYIAAAR